MPLKIDLCVSVPDQGAALLALLAESATLMQSGDNDVSLHFTCHSEAERSNLTKIASRSIEVERTHVIDREIREYYHRNSVTHSRCINALFNGSDADISVICDYDGAFVSRGWDSILIEQILEEGTAFFGVPYSEIAGRVAKLPFGNVEIFKYQNKPNCIMIAYEPRRIKRLSKVICDFEQQFGAPDSLPIKFISSRNESEQFGLPIGTLAQIDTGCLVTELIQRHNLPYSTLHRSVCNYQTINVPKTVDALPDMLRPEEYLYGNKPYFTHFRKGATKFLDTQSTGNYPETSFIADIQKCLRTTLRAEK